MNRNTLVLFLIERVKNLNLFQAGYFFLAGEKWLLRKKKNEDLIQSYIFPNISTIHFFAFHTSWIGHKV